MSNLPRFGRTWQRFSSLPRPAPAGQTASEFEREIAPSASATQTLQPFEPTPAPKATSLPSSPIRESPRVSSPAKKVTSPSSSPKYKPTATRVASPPIKPAASSPTPAYKRYDGGRRVSPTTSPKTFKPAQRVSPTTSPKTFKPAQRLSPTTSPKTFKPAQTSPPPSPKYRQPAAPLSPLTLPRSEVKPAAGTMTRSRSPPEVEQKSVLYQKTVEKPAKSDRQVEYGSGKPPQKQHTDVINITGHNVGAVMEIKQSSDKRDGGEIIKKKETEGSGYANDERKTGEKDKSHKANELPTTTYMNSNFQDINNSLLYDSSCNHRDPGLHLAFFGTPNEDGSIVDGHKTYKL